MCQRRWSGRVSRPVSERHRSRAQATTERGLELIVDEFALSAVTQDVYWRAGSASVDIGIALTCARRDRCYSRTNNWAVGSVERRRPR